MMGYLSSGRAQADYYRDVATMYRRSAHLAFRWGLIGAGKDDIRQALRAWKNFRFYRERIAR